MLSVNLPHFLRSLSYKLSASERPLNPFPIPLRPFACQVAAILTDEFAVFREDTDFSILHRCHLHEVDVVRTPLFRPLFIAFTDASFHLNGRIQVVRRMSSCIDYSITFAEALCADAPDLCAILHIIPYIQRHFQLRAEAENVISLLQTSNVFFIPREDVRHLNAIGIVRFQKAVHKVSGETVAHSQHLDFICTLEIPIHLINPVAILSVHSSVHIIKGDILLRHVPHNSCVQINPSRRNTYQNCRYHPSGKRLVNRLVSLSNHLLDEPVRQFRNADHYCKEKNHEPYSNLI